MILVDACEVKRKFLEIIDEIILQLQKSIHTHIINNNTNIQKEILTIHENISSRADLYEKLVELEQAIDKIRKSEHKRILSEFADLQKWLNLLYTTTFKISEEDLKVIVSTANSVHTLINKVDQEETRLQRDREELESKLRTARESFQNQIDDLYNKIDVLKTQYTSHFQMKEATDVIDGYRRKLQDLLKEMESINEKEELLGWSLTEFPKLLEAQNNLKPYEDLWHLVVDQDNNNQLWTKTKTVFRLDAEQIEKETRLMFSTAKKLTFMFPKNVAGPLKLANDLVEKLKNFQEHMPLVRVFSNQGMKERHWEEISSITGFPIRPDRDLLLSKLIELEITKHLPQLEEISDAATKEANIENILNKMQNDWDPVIAELKPWKDTGTFIIAGGTVDEVQTLLDDQIVKTLTMKGSSFAKTFENRINEWEK